jgi:hypothetical protein
VEKSHLSPGRRVDGVALLHEVADVSLPYGLPALLVTW